VIWDGFVRVVCNGPRLGEDSADGSRIVPPSSRFVGDRRTVEGVHKEEAHPQALAEDAGGRIHRSITTDARAGESARMGRRLADAGGPYRWIKGRPSSRKTLCRRYAHERRIWSLCSHHGGEVEDSTVSLGPHASTARTDTG
jgi:hypothetical protein